MKKEKQNTPSPAFWLNLNFFIYASNSSSLVLIASVIAVPVAWRLMSKWLQGFAYRINISIRVFVMATIIILIIALITVGFQSIKAAIANPVDSLRME